MADETQKAGAVTDVADELVALRARVDELETQLSLAQTECQSLKEALNGVLCQMERDYYGR